MLMDNRTRTKEEAAMKKAVLAVLALLVALSTAAVITGCQNGTTSKKNTASKNPTKKVPIRIDTKKKTVAIYTVVNAKYFSEPTRHGIVFADGSNCDKSVLKTFVEPARFHRALEKIGAKPGNNVMLESPNGTVVEGTSLKVTMKADGSTIDISDAIKCDPQKAFDIKFGGNLTRAQEKKTGCILCLDSCAVGITSNASWGWGAMAKQSLVKFFGREDKLPKDGEAVVVTFSI